MDPGENVVGMKSADVVGDESASTRSAAVKGNRDKGSANRAGYILASSAPPTGPHWSQSLA